MQIKAHLSEVATLAPVSCKVLDRSVSELNFRAIVDGLGEVGFLAAAVHCA